LSDQLATADLPHCRSPQPDDSFMKLTPAIVAWAKSISVDGAVTYTEIECFGSDCKRAAIIWEGGAVVLGPFPFADDEEAEVRHARYALLRQDRDAFIAATRAMLPSLTTNQALRRLGVTRDGAIDEFDALQLGRHRRTEDWFATIR
jgi:hypothetical protein